ncbi:MAG: hypothetical protein KC877_00240 [Candidatus Kaiserbacteria bacterium]|nr:hypothetical protein [Candidatus Kaiserbacteria bacterium]MCB9815862.1 hypothetical protein [Candidatus Nomurabacteria bacterium]
MKIIGFLVVAAIVVAVAGYFMLFGGDTSSETSEEKAAQLAEEAGVSPATDDTRQGSGTLEELRLLGEDLECTIAVVAGEQATTVEGTYFVSDGEIRGDFLTETPDLSGMMLSSMIISEDMMYVWTELEGEKYGVKIDLSLVEEDVNAETAVSQEPVRMDDRVDYRCVRWSNVDRTVFVPPGDVLFQDMSAVMESGMEYGTTYEGGGMPNFEGFEMPQMPELP